MFVQNFEKDCLEGKFCIGLWKETTGKMRNCIYVGKITEVNQQDETFTCRPYKCSKDVWSKECAGPNAKWHSPSGFSKETHHSVIYYFKGLTKQGKLPKRAISAVEDRVISWHEEE